MLSDHRNRFNRFGEIPNLEHYHAHAYLHDDMAKAMGVADVVVCRAGASTLAEFPLFGLPAILIPLAYSWRYQQINADYLADKGVAIHLDENEMDDKLLDHLRDVLHHPEKLDTMRERALALARSDGAKNIADLLMQLAEKTA